MRFFPVLFFSFFISGQLFAQVSQEQVEQMLGQMVKENVISAQEAEKAKIKMNSMNSQEWSSLNQKASDMAASSSRAPASVDGVQAIKQFKSRDLDKAQFKQIEDDIKKMSPDLDF
jgi:hypothetical protein